MKLIMIMDNYYIKDYFLNTMYYYIKEWRLRIIIKKFEFKTYNHILFYI